MLAFCFYNYLSCSLLSTRIHVFVLSHIFRSPECNNAFRPYSHLLFSFYASFNSHLYLLHVAAIFAKGVQQSASFL